MNERLHSEGLENYQYEYLREMGIDVWLVRSETVSEENVSGITPLGSDEAVKAEAGLDATLPSNLADSPRHTGASASLAIVRGAPSNESISAEAERVAAVKQPQTVQTQVNAAIDSPNFLFCFLDYEHFNLLFSLPPSSQSLSTEFRYFADDLNQAIFGSRTIPKVRDLRWPMIQSSHIQQNSEDAAAVMQEKVKHCMGTLVIFGSEPLSYLPDEIGKKSVVVEDISVYFAQSQKKRELWARLKTLRL